METPLPPKSFQQPLEGGRDQGSKHWPWWPFSANAFLPCHLLRTGTAFLHQQARLSCHLYCVQRGKGAKFQPGSGERLALFGVGDWAEMELLRAHIPACCSQTWCCLLFLGVWVKMVCGAQSCCSIRALGLLVNLSSQAEQGTQTVRGQRRVVIDWGELQSWYVLLLLLFTC